MLHRTFCHAPGVGPAMEAKCWAAGLTDWTTFLEAPVSELPVPASKRGLLRQAVEESQERLAVGDAAWFAERLPAREHWRLWATFRDQAA